MRRFLRHILHAVFTAEGLYGLITNPYVWASLSAMGAMIATYASSPYLWIIAPVGALVFAAVAHGMLRLDEWKNLKRVEGKVFVSGLVPAWDFDQNDGKYVLNKFQVGAIIENTSNYPVYYDVDEIFSKIDGRVPKAQVLLNRGDTLPSHTTHTYSDSAIDLGGVEIGDGLEGEFTIKLTIKHTSKEYHIARSFYLFILQGRNGLQLTWRVKENNGK